MIVTIIDPLLGLVVVTGGLATVVAGTLGASRSSRVPASARALWLTCCTAIWRAKGK